MDKKQFTDIDCNRFMNRSSQDIDSNHVLYNEDGYETYSLLVYRGTGYAIVDRRTGLAAEFSDSGSNPYRDVMEYNKLYMGLLNYAYETPRGVVDIMTNRCITGARPLFHNSDDSSSYWKNNFSPRPAAASLAEAEPVIIPHADDIRYSIFGKNTGTICGSVATEIILRYYDKNVKSGFIPSGYRTSATGTALDSRFLSEGLLPYRISALGDDPSGSGTFPVHDALNANLYLGSDEVRRNLGYEFKYIYALTDILRAQIDKGFPVALSTHDEITGMGDHVVVAYGYKEVPGEGLYYLVHRGWESELVDYKYMPDYWFHTGVEIGTGVSVIGGGFYLSEYSTHTHEFASTYESGSAHSLYHGQKCKHCDLLQRNLHAVSWRWEGKTPVHSSRWCPECGASARCNSVLEDLTFKSNGHNHISYCAKCSHRMMSPHKFSPLIQCMYCSATANSFQPDEAINAGSAATQSGLLTVKQPSQWYRFDLSSGKSLSVHLPVCSLVDLDMKLYDSQGTVRALSVNRECRPEAITFHAETAGYYYLNVYANYFADAGFPEGHPSPEISYTIQISISDIEELSGQNLSGDGNSQALPQSVDQGPSAKSKAVLLWDHEGDVDYSRTTLYFHVDSSDPQQNIKIRFSDDGANWGEWETYLTTFCFNGDKSEIYYQVCDNNGCSAVCRNSKVEMTGNKYEDAAGKAYAFLKKMLNPSEWEISPYYGEPYSEQYAGKLMWGGVRQITDPDSPNKDSQIEPQYIYPQYIKPAQYYYPGYHGVIQGTFQLPEGEDPKNFAVAVYRISSSSRSLECYCPLFTRQNDDGSLSYVWSTGKFMEAWEYYQKSCDKSIPYMSDGEGGYVPWKKPLIGSEPTKYYRTQFSTSKVVYWYWEKIKVGSSSSTAYAYEIEFVRKDWTVAVTDKMRQAYMAKPAPRPEEGYVRKDYLGMAALETYTLFDLMELETVHEEYEGVWIDKDDKQIATPDLPEFTTGSSAKIRSQVFTLPDPGKGHKGFIEYGYTRILNYKVNLYTLVLGDAEYLNGEASLWSDTISELPAVPPPIPPATEEITDIAVMLGKDAGSRNFTFLSTIDTADSANVSLSGGTAKKAVREGYISEKVSHVTYKSSLSIPDTAFTYTLRTNTLATPAISMAGRPSVSNVYKFIAAADPQLTTEKSLAAWRESIAKAFQQYPDAGFIATLGDNVDAQVDMSLAEQQFSNYLSPPEMKTHPLLVVMGNHDDNMGFSGHFFPPEESTYGVVGGQGDYWTRHDGTLIMVLNTNTRSEKIQEHISFIDETVTYNSNTYGSPKWKIVLFHHSIFQPTNSAEEKPYVELRNQLAPCFSKQGVDLVLMGHVHSYCRTHVLDCSAIPMGGAVTETAIVPDSGGSEFTKVSDGQTLYVTLNSASGSKYYVLSGTHWYAAKSNQELIPHITCVDVNNSRIMITTHRTNDMHVIDQFTLRK